MEKKAFFEAIEKEVAAITAKPVKVMEVANSTKKYTGLVIGNAIALPILCLDDWYEKVGGFKTLSEMAEKILLEYDAVIAKGKDKIQNVTGLAKDILMGSFDEVKDRLQVRLVGKAPEDLVTRDVLGMKATCHVVLGAENDGTMISTPVNPAMLERWDVTADELFRVGLAATFERTPITGQPMNDVLAECGMLPPETHAPLVPLNILSVKGGMNGAVVLMDSDTLKSVYDTVGEYWVLPSSVHEVLYFKKNEADPADLKAMVMEINRTCLKEGEFLSDNVFVYDGTELKIAA